MAIYEGMGTPALFLIYLAEMLLVAFPPHAVTPDISIHSVHMAPVPNLLNADLSRDSQQAT